ncbi:MAG: RluA family pseudouridine synthase, partial [Armatimonadetes bacterium]|nr:RluA family pseudouridine synthase [Armatimonadota bacterium]
IPLSVIFEDEWLLVVDKPAGMVVHPARGNWSGTLVNALLHRGTHLAATSSPARPGIVHRLDQFTSGVIVCAKSDEAYARLGPQFEYRRVQKEYLAITEGQPELDEDEIDLPLGVDPANREKVAVRLIGGRRSITRYHVIERLGGHAFVRVEPKTGRTHQIRVHLLSIRCPVLCDRLYSSRSKLLPADLGLPGDEPLLARQALHAHRLSLEHPRTGERMTFEAQMPGDMARTLEALRRQAEGWSAEQGAGSG